MDFPICVQGRCLRAADISWLKALMESNPDWNRSKLSRHIARHWEWRNAAGLLKDIAARTMLRKLEARGLILLPPRQRGAPHSRRSKRQIEPVLHGTDPVEEALGNLRPVHLESGGELIDSPGVRSFRLGPLSREQLERGFREFLPLIGQCRFHNCVHLAEPGCAIRAAVEAGDIPPQRLESYQHMVTGVNDGA